MTAAEYCDLRARYWRDEIADMPPTSPSITAEAQLAFAESCAAFGPEPARNNAQIAERWSDAAARLRGAK